MNNPLRLSPLRSRRSILVSLVLLSLILIAATVSASYGMIKIPFTDAVSAALGNKTGTMADFVVGQVRAPRLLTAILVGALFGLSGALMQSGARNPLASPDILGISAGATAGAVLFIGTTGNASSLATVIPATLGALATLALIATLSWKNGLHPMRIVVSGIGIGFVAVSITTYMMTTLPERQAAQTFAWTTGSTHARVWEHVHIAAVGLAVILPIALLLTRHLRVSEMGDDLTRGLGISLGRTQLLGFATAAVAAGIAASVVGPVGFIALVAPAIARTITRSPGYAPIPSALMGALLTVLADFAAREALSPTQLPIGLFTAAIGAPYLIYLVIRARRLFS